MRKCTVSSSRPAVPQGIADSGSLSRLHLHCSSRAPDLCRTSLKCLLFRRGDGGLSLLDFQIDLTQCRFGAPLGAPKPWGGKRRGPRSTEQGF
ncbi:unnamed protein product [Nezara viridula]|uniref:Uncharacterized protein n=1 Tax=Nezara viridula TaxID=85310 RepID=A0A9P0HSR9_NEZVI|nr:unnamed protein product [Nezara viridula]